MEITADVRIEKYLKNIKQVFLYIIDKCNLNCVQCLYKPNNLFHIGCDRIELNTAKSLIRYFRDLGAGKLTIMGGEPTLYGIEENRKPLLELIRYAKEIGYEYVRIDTNGTFESKLLEDEQFKLLDEITFSLDGPNAEINDRIRGKGVFDLCSENITHALELGYNCDITCCIHKWLIERDESGQLFLDKMILFAEQMGIHRINFHDLFKSGIPRDTWTGHINISIEQWFEVWDEIQSNIEKRRYGIPVRIPQGFVAKERFAANRIYYGYCSAKTGDRILIHPDGILRVCSLMIGTPYGIGRFYDDKIVWDESGTNELACHEMDAETPCTNQSKSKTYGPFLPLCVSFKPKQNEFAWNKLEWEKCRRE
ncbi:MAG: radical SAM protein [Lachnospiraceae bacterium]|nr:radical SAM protein [Lachnospiraceae bacterium]